MHSRQDKKSPTGLIQHIKRPWLLASALLHGLLLFIPLPPSSPVISTSLKPVKLTRLPPSPSPTLSPIPKPSLLPQPSLLPKPPQAIAPRSPQAIAPSPLPPLAIAPSTPAVAVTPVPSAPLAPTPATPTPPPTPSPVPDPYATFPHVPGAQAGCAGSERCWQTGDTQWRSVAVNVQQDLKTKGYSLESIPLDDETGRQVYRVSKPGETPYYLSFISTPQGTIYSFTDQPMTSEEMKLLAGI